MAAALQHVQTYAPSLKLDMFKAANADSVYSGETVTVARVDSASMYVVDWVLVGQAIGVPAVVVVVVLVVVVVVVVEVVFGIVGVGEADDGDGDAVVVCLVLSVLCVTGFAVTLKSGLFIDNL